MMVGKVGYKQSKVYFNNIPNIKTRIDSISSIVKSKFNPNNKNAINVEEMLKRPTTYCFSVIAKTEQASSFAHDFYFEDKETAIKEHNKILKKFFDQQTAQYVNKLNKGLKLTIQEQTILINTMNKLLSLKTKKL